MPKPLDDATLKQLAARVNYYREMGIYDFYRREAAAGAGPFAAAGSSTVEAEPEPAMVQPAERADVSPQLEAAGKRAGGRPPSDTPLPVIQEKPSALQDKSAVMQDKPAALRLIREEIGDCTRCRLHQGRNKLVFGVGNVNADIMFVGEGPGADEDAQGEPFVGRAGQLLNSMITAMGLKREEVYIANVVKCRPPGNRTPEKDECDVCSPFLLRQIDVVKPKVIVALGAVAAKNLLAVSDSMANLRGRWYDFRDSKLLVTYHPAYLLRDPRQKKEAWKDLQMAMKYLGLKAPAKTPQE